VCVGGGAFKFKEEKNHGVLSEMTEAFESKRFESKRLWKERQGNHDDAQIESRATTTTTTTSPPPSIGSLFMTYLRMTPPTIS
jgi:hypothetical protein